MKHGISIWDWYVGNKPTSVPICLFVWVLHIILGIEARGFWMVFYEYLPARLIQTWKKKKKNLLFLPLFKTTLKKKEFSKLTYFPLNFVINVKIMGFFESQTFLL